MSDRRTQPKKPLTLQIFNICGPGELTPKGIANTFGVTTAEAHEALESLVRDQQAFKTERGYKLRQWNEDGT